MALNILEPPILSTDNLKRNVPIGKKGVALRQPSKELHYSSEWFRQLTTLALHHYLHLHQPLNGTAIEDLCRDHSIAIPEDIPIDSLVETLNWRIRNRRASLMPLFNSKKSFENLRLKDYQKFITAVYKGHSSKRLAVLKALKVSFIPYLKSIYSKNPYMGARNLSNPWTLRVVFLTNEFLVDFKSYCSNFDYQQRHYEDIENLRNLLLNTKSLAYFSRKKKFDVGSGEIESLLKTYLKIPHVYTSARTAASETRKLIKLAGIKTLEELLSPEGQNQIISLEYTGKIGQYAMSRPRACLRWIYETHNVTYPPYFSNLSEQAIFDLSTTPEIGKIISDAWAKLEEYEETNLNKLKVFFRLILRTTEATTAKKFYALKPSDWIKVILEAEAKGNHLQSFRAIKMFRKAFFLRLPREKQWPEKGRQSFQSFLAAVQADPFFKSTGIGSTLRLSEFEVAFSQSTVYWGRFFDLLQDLFYRVADSEKDDSSEKGDSFIIGSEDFIKSQDYIIERAYGVPSKAIKGKSYKAPDGKWRSGGLLNKRVYTEEEKRELEIIMAYCLQSVGPSRFAHEANRIIFSEKVPRLVSVEGPHCLFWWPEKKCYAILFSKSRKNDVSYLCPLNDLADSLLDRYFKLYPKSHGERLFNYNIQKLVDEIKRHNVIVHKPSCSFQDFQNGVRFRGVTPHSMRHMLRRYIEANYNGPDKELILTVALGHKIRDDATNRSSASGYYGDNLNYSVVVFDQLRRIKNGNVLTAEQIELRQLRNDVLKSDKKTRKQLREGVEKLSEKAEIQMALSKANLLATVFATSEEVQVDFLSSLLERSPELLVKMLKKK